MRKTLTVMALGLAMTTSAHATSLCDNSASDSLKIVGERAVLALAPILTALPVSEPFTLSLEVCDAPHGTEVIRFNARMPAHGHGMSYMPELKPLGDGRYRADNVILHMPGVWEFIIDVRANGKSERLTAETNVGP